MPYLHRPGPGRYQAVPGFRAKVRRLCPAQSGSGTKPKHRLAAKLPEGEVLSGTEMDQRYGKPEPQEKLTEAIFC